MHTLLAVRTPWHCVCLDATVLVNAVSIMFADTKLTNCWINAVDVAQQAGYSDNLAVFVAGNREQGGLRWAFRRRAPLGVRLFITIKNISHLNRRAPLMLHLTHRI